MSRGGGYAGRSAYVLNSEIVFCSQCWCVLRKKKRSSPSGGAPPQAKEKRQGATWGHLGRFSTCPHDISLDRRCSPQKNYHSSRSSSSRQPQQQRPQQQPPQLFFSPAPSAIPSTGARASDPQGQRTVFSNILKMGACPKCCMPKCCNQAQH